MLPRRHSKRLTLGVDTYRYRIRAVTAADRQVQFVVTVQHEELQGALLRVLGLTATRVPDMESRCYMGRTLDRSLTPVQIAGLIGLAKEHGWKPALPGPAFVWQTQNSAVFAAI